MEKAIITVIGKDKKGIIAGVCAYLAENDVNILDITQTILDGFFTMMMVVDISGAKSELSVLQAGLNEVAENIGVDIKAQREDIFNKMHRI